MDELGLQEKVSLIITIIVVSVIISLVRRIRGASLLASLEINFEPLIIVIK